MKTLMILPYFGEFNDYFELWLSSCAYNLDFDWIIFTNIEFSKELPKNVRIIKSTLPSLKHLFENKLKLNIVLDRAYKLCDYKQYYGYLFSEYLDGYDFWGYCDCDLIFGDIRSFMTVDIQKNYDKLFRTGHFSVIRNDKNINELFFRYDTYKITLTSPAIYGYDESIYGYHLGFAGELLENGFKFKDFANWIADVNFRYYPFYEIFDSKDAGVYLYDSGHIYRLEKRNDNISKEEKMYVHLQKRKMTVDKDIDPTKYIICPNRFCKYDEDLLKSDIFWESIMKNHDDYFDFKLEKKQNFKRDIIRLLHEPNKFRSILYRIRGH